MSAKIPRSADNDYSPAIIAERQHFLRGVGDRVEPGSRLVDTDVGCLSRQQYRNQQLEIGCVFQPRERAARIDVIAEQA